MILELLRERHLVESIIGEIAKSHGFIGLIVALVFIEGIHLLAKLLEMIWSWAKKDIMADKRTIEKLTISVERLDDNLEKMMPLLKLPQDMKRMYKAIKILAGPRWEEISEKIMKKQPDDIDQ